MAAEKVVKAPFWAPGKAPPRCTRSSEVVLRLVACCGAATAFAVASGLSCSGPLPDTCVELGTCVPPPVALAGLDAGTDGSADVGASADVEASADAGASADVGATADVEASADAEASADVGATADVEASADAEASADVGDSADVVKACDPTRDPKDDPCVLDDAYGVFVAPSVSVDAGQDGGAVERGAEDGSAAQPYATIGQALTNLGQKKRIYVCSGIYREQVYITRAVNVYGGLSCAPGASARTWTYTGAAAQVDSPSPAYALSVSGVSSGVVAIEDVSFASPDATLPGESSMAALVVASSVSLVRVALNAGSGVNGARGADGTANPNYTGLAPSGGAQVWTTISGLFSPISGGAGAVNQCLLFGSSAGGNGGLGCASAAGVQGGAGTAGTAKPEPPVVAAGRDGLPLGASTGGDGGLPVTTNDPGADGVAGDGGVAAAPQIFGALSASGWTPTGGGDGAGGEPGQGGAGASDPLYGQCNVQQPSLGGGGGGAGGCGGAGGKGGSGGGASIALASVGGIVNLTSCSLTTSAAGTGGAGGAGEDGQAGGAGGDVSGASQLHAAGASGGDGAGGSGGAGGTGGISVGVLASNSTITVDASTTQNTVLGAPGAGGAAGPAGRHGTGALTTGVNGNSGAPGSPGTSVALLKLM